jgi:cyclopropane fatty-acyl-phospholipid synthase-like methyltransferase
MDLRDRFNQKYLDNPQLFNTPPLPIVVKAAEALEGGRVLDLGVGNGRNAKHLLNESLSVTGVDSSQEGLRVLRREVGDDPNLELVCDDVMNFQTGEQYDLVVATGLLHFLDAADIDDLLDKMTAWTTPGGRNAVAVRMSQNPPGNLPHVFDHNELRNTYEQVGWSIEHYHEADTNDHQVASIIARKP